MDKVRPRAWFERLLDRMKADTAPAVDRSRTSLLRSCGDSAAHEAGHAIVAWFSPSVTSVRSVSVTDTGGKVVARLLRGCPSFDWDLLTVNLAGLAGELTVFDTVKIRTVHSDLLDALRVIERLRDGCDRPERAIPWRFRPGTPVPDFSRIFRKSVDTSRLKLMRVGYWRARNVILDNWPLFATLTEELAIRKTLDKADLKEFMGEPVVIDASSITTVRAVH